MKVLLLELWQECRRLAERLRWRGQLWRLEREESKAERSLGELAWQQVDYAEESTEVVALQTTEHREAGLLFEMGEIKEQMTAYAAGMAEETGRAQGEIATIDATASETEGRAMRLLKTLQVETKLGSPDFVCQQLQNSLDIEEAALRSQRQKIITWKVFIEDLKKTTAVHTDGLRQSLKALEMELESLRRKKNLYYLGIGRELANAEIAPMNQPEALVRVLQVRREMNDIAGALSSSRAASVASSRSIQNGAKVIGGVLGLAVFLGLRRMLEIVQTLFLQ